MRFQIFFRDLWFSITKRKLLTTLCLVLLLSTMGLIYVIESQDTENDSNLFDSIPFVNKSDDSINTDIATIPTPLTTAQVRATSTAVSRSNGSSGSSSNPSSGSTPTSESLTATVAFYSDNQSDTDGEDANHQSAVNNILATGANSVFHAGDLMEDGTQNSLDRFNAVTATLRATRTFYAALGNNDRVVGDASTPSALFFANFSFPNNEQWYSVNIGNLHMVVLDSAFSSGSASQLSWLQTDLQSAASQSRITGVMFHHPTFASSISTYLINNGVDFVVSGHTHSYTHSTDSGINGFVLSGQTALGYSLAHIYDHHVVFKTYNSSNSLVESVSFNER